MEHKELTDTRTMEFAERVIEKVRAITPELSKRGINYDHFQIKSLIETAELYQVMSQILVELKAMNQRELRKEFPMSLLNNQTVERP